MKLIVDMNLSPRWISLLAGAGMQAVHWSTIGRRNAPDAEIMAYATTNDYVVLTHDLDFSAILAATQGEKPSIVQILADDVSPDVIGLQAIAALRQMELDPEEGALLTVDLHHTRAATATEGMTGCEPRFEGALASATNNFTGVWQQMRGSRNSALPGGFFW